MLTLIQFNGIVIMIEGWMSSIRGWWSCNCLRVFIDCMRMIMWW